MKLTSLFESGAEELSAEQVKWLERHVDAFKFHKTSFFGVNGKIRCNANVCVLEGLENSYSNIPDYIRFGKVRSIAFSGNSVITDFSLIPETSKEILFFSKTKMPSCKGIQKVIRSCETLALNDSFIDGLLDIMQINGLKSIGINTGSVNPRSKKIERTRNAIEIAIRTLEAGEDAFDLQDALHSAGLEEYC